jgi:hypothetical protein
VRTNQRRPASTSTTPSSGSRCGSIIDRRSFCASNQAVLYVMPSWASNWSADMPFEWVAEADTRSDATNLWKMHRRRGQPMVFCGGSGFLDSGISQRLTGPEKA